MHAGAGSEGPGPGPRPLLQRQQDQDFALPFGQRFEGLAHHSARAMDLDSADINRSRVHRVASGRAGHLACPQ